MKRRQRQDGTLYYKGRKVNPETFQLVVRGKKKDLRRLVGTCHRCGTVLRGQAALPSPDPYASDVEHDDTPVVQCEICSESSAQDI
jgi:hypothetical protein